MIATRRKGTVLAMIQLPPVMQAASAPSRAGERSLLAPARGN
jgi:hypothetical protein